jgi:hypothetical protein
MDDHLTCVLSRKVTGNSGGSLGNLPLLPQYNYGYKGLKNQVFNQVFNQLDGFWRFGLHIRGIKKVL